jgi:hypothetical protein
VVVVADDDLADGHVDGPLAALAHLVVGLVVRQDAVFQDEPSGLPTYGGRLIMVDLRGIYTKQDLFSRPTRHDTKVSYSIMAVPSDA